MPQATCPYPGCEWKQSGWLERTVDLARELHIALCPSAPRVRDQRIRDGVKGRRRPHAG